MSVFRDCGDFSSYSRGLRNSITHSALAPSGQDIWLQMAVESAHALKKLMEGGVFSDKF